MFKFIFTCLIFTPFFVLSQNNWTLQQCIKHALQHNISLKQQALTTEINKNNTLQSKANVLPNINLGAAHTYNFGQTIDRFTNTFANTMVLSQNFYGSTNVLLWNGFSQFNNIKANEFNYLSSVENLKQTQNDISLSVANAFINLAFAEELIKISENQLNLSKEQLERTKKLIAAGSLAKSYEYDLLAQVATDESNYINYTNNYQIAKLNLVQIMNLDSSLTFEINLPKFEIDENNILTSDVNSIYETALKNQPNIKGATYQIQSAEKNLLAAKGRISPSINLSGSIGTGYSGLAKEITSVNSSTQTIGMTTSGDYVIGPTFEPNYRNKSFSDQFKDNVNKSIGVSINIPVFNGLQTHTAIQNAKINALNTKLTSDLVKQNLYKTIVQAHTNAKAALKKFIANQTNLNAANESFKFVQQKFDAGTLNAFDYSNAKNRVFVAESNLLQAKFDYIFKLKVLDFYQGKELTL
jgi:outer membrane protein